MKKLFPGLLLFFFSFTGPVKGQDPHFSQYFSSPLTLNPAMTGYFKGDYRFSANFRQQWQFTGAPFVTGTFSYDTKLLQSRVPENDIFAMGLLGLYDQSLAGGFKNINLSASLSYHKSLDAEGINNIGIGFQFTYASRMINFSDLNFATQFNGSGFDTNLPSYETLGNQHSNYFDVNAGILYTHKTENKEFYLGGSLYHLGGPNTSFLKNESFKLPIRFTVHGGARFKVGDSGNDLFIGGLYMKQAGATEKNIGIAYGITLNDVAKLYAGSWYRIGDAFLPYVGLSYNRCQIGISYDVTNSSLKNYTTNSGSFELSLIFLGTKPKNVYSNYKGGGIF